MSAEVARKLLMEHCTSAFLRKQLAAGLSHDDRIWRELSDISLVGMLMPESAGGLALSEVDFVLIAEACGYAALPGPFVEHAGVAGPFLAAAAAAAVGGAAADSITEYWQIHTKGQNVMFADGHAKWSKGFNAGEMTFGYNVMTNWMTRM